MTTHRLARRPFAALLVLGAAVALPSTAAAPTRFAAVGDTGNSADSAAVARLVRAQGAQFLLMLGDLCYGTKPISEQVAANYQAEKVGGRLWPVLGNHEFSDACGGGAGAAGYRALFRLPNNERYYEFTRGPVHFFALNSDQDADGIDAGSRQALWLKAKLAASRAPWQIVFFHHPPFSSGDHGPTLHMQWPFEAWGADVVLSGHDHNYERLMIDANGDGTAIPYVVSGLGGRSRRAFKAPAAGSVVRYNTAYGALFVTATSRALAFEFRDVGGAVVDRFNVAKRRTRGR